MDSMLDSPTTSRGIDMMDLDPNMMDEPYDSGFLQSSAPIPIRYACQSDLHIFFYADIYHRDKIIHEEWKFHFALQYLQRQNRGWTRGC